jgi:hypothetical protein
VAEAGKRSLSRDRLEAAIVRGRSAGDGQIGIGLSLRKNASTFRAIEYRETSAGEGDERSFTRAARQLQRAALEQSGID